MKCKPTPQGYKIFALCGAGYTYPFLYYSRTDSIVGVTPIRRLSSTSTAVVHLARTLPYSSYRCNIYMDNYFTNIPLFKHLRDLQIGACGTVRPSSKEYLGRLKGEKSDQHSWNTLSGVVVDQAVLATVWIDNVPATMLSTIHKITGTSSFIERTRWCPRNTSSNAQVVPLPEQVAFVPIYRIETRFPILQSILNEFGLRSLDDIDVWGVDLGETNTAAFCRNLRASLTSIDTNAAMDDGTGSRDQSDAPASSKEILRPGLEAKNLIVNRKLLYQPVFDHCHKMEKLKAKRIYVDQDERIRGAL
ncbi:hypothetical protein BGZ47_000025 [Haplosporangium gracile]|nr:hypothetical protein BGZ47_000025 [Haplosporangium gracile]